MQKCKQLNLQSNCIRELVKDYVKLQNVLESQHLRVGHSHIHHSSTIWGRGDKMHCWLGQTAHKYHCTSSVSVSVTKSESTVYPITLLVCGATYKGNWGIGSNSLQGCAQVATWDIHRGCKGGYVCGGTCNCLECGQEWEEWAEEWKVGGGRNTRSGIMHTKLHFWCQIVTVVFPLIALATQYQPADPSY